ncbi:sigma-70 family RNA polymerase sigma factor [Anaeromyxobacter diazotrophicus]|uniref:Uncharacterized protein n=1 Tax=Anaeromyxobacter diazotrophicus TaxID=2590199 RepID=A0A7I9VR19_9BACT|nr:sigma-70 family RNA polymerase sigma factor [Anaeromyxobacter diazotrophicus]GEJ58417.1 hypothetical protein AMYX_31580 [Anaeromyxobacter diazotrophicus]
MEELVKYAKAILALQLQRPVVPANGEAGTAVKPEVLLAGLGFTHKEIGDLLGKSPNAVNMVVKKARKKGSKT